MSEATGEKVEIQKSCTDLCFLIIQAVVTCGAINPELHL